ncbi:MAG TPA: (d)CMP kinase, partial [Candidatus Sumerlaeota bacterium]|nr:(d)CMP kinase [Candidatus Sumerlaeota bacterium]
DIGTIVFPDAFWKFYLDAALEERTRRRVLQLEAAGKKVDFQDTMEAIRIRDQRDRTRPWGPLAIAPDAIVIDTTSLSQNQVVNTILTFIRSGRPNR